MKRNTNSKNPMNYCSTTGTKQIPTRCLKLALECMNSKPDQEVLLHLGECKNCDEQNVCLSNPNPSAFQVGGGRKNVSRKGPLSAIMKFPVCGADGKELDMDLCAFNVARCQALENEEDVPQGSKL